MCERRQKSVLSCNQMSIKKNNLPVKVKIMGKNGKLPVGCVGICLDELRRD